MKIMSLLGQ